MCEYIGNIILVILIVILLWVLYKVVFGPRETVPEGFYTYPGYYKKYCPSCNNLSSYSCAFCSSCGTCTTVEGLKYCVPGDSTGPYYATDCVEYSYGDPYAYYPGGNVFPVVKTMDQFPYNIINRTGFDHMKGYNKYEQELRKTAAENRELARRLEHSKQ